ncbi:NACHT, LRR and PYD domains-containing protein 1b allele 2 isoform X1 [Conger conger]|uniref:NACHT, LRR and PYD domains-containing protein 1b allele 2 isoform X1 n=1 Tax=Conger conger TaxID=82655 RepID=UPI002A5A8516|nr:NACHT, LRR and PYD domains-containing protein 1b allele 2 isoform X1 [Conger conger]
MVAEMTSFGSSASFEESERDISPPDQKGNVSENESSGSDSTETSTGESSADEGSDRDAAAAAEDDEEEEKDAIEGGASRHDQDPVLEPNSEEQSGTDAVRRVCCERCQLMQSQDQGFERVNPRRISRGRLLALLDAEGVYECSVTGLVFEVTQKAQVRYSVLSWSKFGAYLQDSWKFAGPIFDVDCDPAILTAIQLPHSLCLADPADAVSFSVLHVKGGRGLVEAVSDHGGGRVKWRVSSLSPVGAIVQTPRPAEHHGVVLVFRQLAQRSSNSFHVYIATNNESDIKDIKKEVRIAKKRFVMLDKPATCLLQEESKYQLTSDPEGDITPECLRFTQAVLKMKSYFEVFFEQPPPFKLSLVEAESGQTVWSTTLREGDFEDMNANEKPKRGPEGEFVWRGGASASAFITLHLYTLLLSRATCNLLG